MADLNKLAPPSLNMLRDANGRIYFAPAQPSFDTMQKVAIPGYQVKQTQSGSYVNSSTPDTVYISSLDAPSYVNPEKILKFTKAHELQHQIEGKAVQQGQTQSDAIQRAWVDNARQLGINPSKAYSSLVEKLSNPDVQAYLEKLGSRTGSRLRKPTESPLEELMADIGGWQTNGHDLTKDPFLAKTVFNDPNIANLVKSTTGMSGTVIGDSDYKPYSLEAAEAWGAQLPKSKIEMLKSLFK